MQVILTPTAVADKFGVGLNGFADSVPGPPTQLSEQWFDSVQMELVNVILGQGIALDGLQFDQLKQALDDYTFVDPIVLSTLTIDSGAALFIASGAGFVLQNGSTFAVESGVTLIAADNTWVWGTSNANDWTINGDVTLGTDGTNAHTINGDVTIGTGDASTHAIIGSLDIGVGGGATTVNIGVAETTTLNIYSDTTFDQGLFSGVPAVQTTNGKLWYDGTNWRVGNGAAINTLIGVRPDYVVSDDTMAANDDLTGASVTMTITPDEWIYAKIEAKQLRTTNASTCNLGIAATNGVETVTILNVGDPDQAICELPASTTINQTHPNSIVVRWKPTNDVAVPSNNNWTIYGRHGVSAGTLTSSNVYLQVWR